MIDLEEDKLWDSCKEVEGETSYSRQVLGMKSDLWDKVRGLGSKAWKGMTEKRFFWFEHVSRDQEYYSWFPRGNVYQSVN